jgi:nucleoside-diphosphate-sugar epimerase
MKALLIGGAGATGVCIANGLEQRGYAVTILHRGVHEPAEISGYRHLHADPHFADPVRDAIGRETFDVVVLTYGRIKALASLFSGRCARLLAVGGIPIYAGYLDPGACHPAGMRIASGEDDPLVPDTSGNAATRFGAKMIEAENAVLAEHARRGYAASLFRYPIIYGPYGISVVANPWSIIRRHQDGRSFVLLPNAGLGVISRSAAQNAAHCMLLALDRPESFGQVFNCADDVQYSLGQWTEIIIELLGARMEVIGLPKPLNWAAAHLLPLGGTVTDHAIVDVGKAKRMLGYVDEISPIDAMAKTIEWQLRNPPTGTRASWEDPFDYDLEDRIMELMAGLYRQAAPLTRAVEAVHPYPHPVAPAAARDHRGR